MCQAVGGGGIVSVRRLSAGSTTLHALDVLASDGRRHELVLRRFDDAQRLGTDPWYIPANEARVLRLLDGSGVAAPRLLAEDTGALEAIHAVDRPGTRALPAYQPYYDPAVDGERQCPPWSRRPRLWQRVFETVAGPPPDTDMGFIHRDYHPGQTLWSQDRLVGVVDWVTGCWGLRGMEWDGYVRFEDWVARAAASR